METLDLVRTMSRDGTEIAAHVTGDGPPLVLVHGSTSDHTTWDRLLPHLEPHVTAYAIDRRGRGSSGDAPAYDLAREFEDVATVVEMVADASHDDVAVFGHSYGALCALGAATLTSRIGTLVLYEPPLRPDGPDGYLERIEAVQRESGGEASLLTFYREVLHLSEEVIAALRGLPNWPARVALAHTLPRELRAVDRGGFDPARAADIDAPTLLLVGELSDAWVQADTGALATALPDGRVDVLPGQEHIAHFLAPDDVAHRIVRYVEERS